MREGGRQRIEHPTEIVCVGKNQLAKKNMNENYVEVMLKCCIILFEATGGYQSFYNAIVLYSLRMLTI